jgi:hypothetical protein
MSFVITSRTKFPSNGQSDNNDTDREDAATPSKKGLVFLNGLVVRPGKYNLPNVGSGLTVGRLITSAGGVTADAPYIITVMDGRTGRQWSWNSLEAEKPQDFVLNGGDHIDVQFIDRSRSSDATIDRARADALYDFVKTLMTEVGVEHAGDHAHIRKVLDKMEAELPTKYPNNPDLQGLIREMIGGRRKILEFDERPPGANADAAGNAKRYSGTTGDADVQRSVAEIEAQKELELQPFVQNVLSKAGATATLPTTVDDFLKLARQVVGSDVTLAPESRSAMQRLLDRIVPQMKSAQATQPATP